jgi:hypothetical protein
VKTQIRIAVPVCVLVANRSQAPSAGCETLQILGLSLFEKMPISQALQPSDSQSEFPDPGK